MFLSKLYQQYPGFRRRLDRIIYNATINVYFNIINVCRRLHERCANLLTSINLQRYHPVFFNLLPIVWNHLKFTDSITYFLVLRPSEKNLCSLKYYLQTWWLATITGTYFTLIVHLSIMSNLPNPGKEMHLSSVVNPIYLQESFNGIYMCLNQRIKALIQSSVSQSTKYVTK